MSENTKNIMIIIGIIAIIAIIIGISKLTGNKHEEIKKLAQLYEELNVSTEIDTGFASPIA